MRVNISKDSLSAVKKIFDGANPAHPPYQKTVYAMMGAIATGVFTEGDYVPSAAQLSGALEINPMTANKALGHLAAAGIIKMSRGRNGSVCGDAEDYIKKRIHAELRNTDTYLLAEKSKIFGFSKSEIIQWIRSYWG